MMNDLNLKSPSQYTEDYLEDIKKQGLLTCFYQLDVSMKKYLPKHGLFNEETRNADAVVLISSSVKTGYGMFYYLVILKFFSRPLWQK